RFRSIGNMVGFRNATVANWFITDWWDNGRDQIAFGRGDLGFVAINRGASALQRSFHTALPPGSYCDVISGDFAPASSGAPGSCSGDVVQVDASGNAALSVPTSGAAAIHASARIGD